MTKLGMTYQDCQELMSPGLIISDFSGGSRKHLVLVTEVGDDDLVYIQHRLGMGFGRFGNALGGRSEEKEF